MNNGGSFFLTVCRFFQKKSVTSGSHGAFLAIRYFTVLVSKFYRIAARACGY
jgi:hypothetical protein